MWCSVLNSLLFPGEPTYHKLHTPPQVVSQSEHTQISNLLSTFSNTLRELQLPLDELRSRISKPIRPVWVTPDSHLTQTGEIYADYHPLICCTVSRRVAGAEASEGGYIQGAGDDTENWAHGLTPSVFWANYELLFSTSEYELPDLIASLLIDRLVKAESGQSDQCIKPTSCLFISDLPPAQVETSDTSSCTIFLSPISTKISTWQSWATRLDVGLGPHKLGSRSLRTALPIIIQFTEDFMRRTKGIPDSDKRITIVCKNEKDHSIGVALAMLCLLFDDKGSLRDAKIANYKVDKMFIRRRLNWIATSLPNDNPSRSTLQSVNSFLMDQK